MQYIFMVESSFSLLLSNIADLKSSRLRWYYCSERDTLKDCVVLEPQHDWTDSLNCGELFAVPRGQCLVFETSGRLHISNTCVLHGEAETRSSLLTRCLFMNLGHHFVAMQQAMPPQAIA